MKKSFKKQGAGRAGRGSRTRSARNRKRKDPLGMRAARFLKLSAKILLLVTALPALLYSGWKVYGFIITTEHLAIKNIDVTGTVMVSSTEALGLLGISPGENIFSFSSAEVRENLHRNPWVKSVSIRRKLPDTVMVQIKEKTPVVLVRTDELYVMDHGGTLFKKFDSAEELDLPVVTGLTDKSMKAKDPTLAGGLLELLGLLKEREGFNIHMVSEIRADPTYGYSLYTLAEGVRLELGMEGFEGKLRAFERVMAARGGSLRGVEAVELKDNKEVIVKFITNVVKGGGAA
jgi:cell division protein FtsQ